MDLLNPFLHPWDETYLITVVGLFHVLGFGLYFTEYFCISVHEGNLSRIPSLLSLCGLCIRVTVAS